MLIKRIKLWSSRRAFRFLFGLGFSHECCLPDLFAYNLACEGIFKHLLFFFLTFLFCQYFCIFSVLNFKFLHSLVFLKLSHLVSNLELEPENESLVVGVSNDLFILCN
mgnify:CR=1 FL=1